MDFAQTDEERDVVQTVRSFIQREVMPYEPIVLQRALAGGPDNLTSDEVAGLQATAQVSGLWGIGAPAEFGGAELTAVAETLLSIELGRTFLTFSFGGLVVDTLYHLNDEQKERYLYPSLSGEKKWCFAMSEPGVGSDARGIKTTAVRVGDEWVINGEKLWISGGHEADFAVLFARTPHEGDDNGMTVFLVDRSMGWESSPFPTMGSSSRVASLSFQDVRVPQANVVGDVNKGYESFALSFFHRNRLMLAARAAGTMDRLIEMGADWASQRVTFGEPLAQRENIRWMIADGEVASRAAKLLCLHAASAADRGADYRHAANAAKLFVARAACRVADDVLQIHGAMGYAKELPVERLYRDLRVLRIYEGTDEMQRLSLSRDLYKRFTSVGNLE